MALAPRRVLSSRGSPGFFCPDAVNLSVFASDLGSTMDAERDIEDALLLIRAQNGDADAFTHFVLRWQDRLRVHAERLTGHPAAADDVLQETWIAALRRPNWARCSAASP